MTEKKICQAKTYCRPTVKVVPTVLSGVLCESLDYTVTPTEVNPAGRTVYNGGDFDSLE